jgi:hypothetical protein
VRNSRSHPMSEIQTLTSPPKGGFLIAVYLVHPNSVRASSASKIKKD